MRVKDALRAKRNKFAVVTTLEKYNLVRGNAPACHHHLNVGS
jgi:hypothetical protein